MLFLQEGNNIPQQSVFNFYGEILKWENIVKYLGNYTSWDLIGACDMKYKNGDFIGRVNSLTANFKFVTCGVKKTLSYSNCCICYDCQTWDMASKP